MRDLLAREGLEAGRDYSLVPVGNGGKRLKAMLADRTISAAILNPPFTAIATANGLRVLANMDAVAGPYQAGGGFALRGWLDGHEATVEAYIGLYVAALAAMTAEETSCRALLEQNLGLTPDITATTWAQVCDPLRGFQPRAKLDAAGIERMLAIRAKARPEAASVDPRQLVDERLYNRVIEGLDHV